MLEKGKISVGKNEKKKLENKTTNPKRVRSTSIWKLAWEQVFKEKDSHNTAKNK